MPPEKQFFLAYARKLLRRRRFPLDATALQELEIYAPHATGAWDEARHRSDRR